MLAPQKTLLADVRAIQDDALKLYNSGVKIPGVVQKLRAAGDELETRVRFLEKQARPDAPAAKPKHVKPPPPPAPPTVSASGSSAAN